MVRKSLPVVMAIALICSVGGKTVSANPSDPETKVKAPNASTASSDEKKDARSSEKLKQDVLKMVADAKAGKSSIPGPQIQTQAKRNNLSKGAKIAIVAGIAAAIVVVVIVKHTKDHMFDGFNGQIF